MDVTLEKMITGGQAMGTLESGKKVFVWGGLPGETVAIEMLKEKKNFAEAMMVEVLDASEHRVKPRDADSYMSTSPWQTMDFAYENEVKKQLTSDAFTMHKIDLPDSWDEILTKTDGREYEYRNKQNYLFTTDVEDITSVQFAVTKRGTHEKQAASSSALPVPAILETAEKVLNAIRKSSLKPQNLQGLLIRSNAQGDTVAKLWLTTKNIQPSEFSEFENFQIAFFDTSRSREGDVLLTKGSNELTDAPFTYNIDSFFQVNQPVYAMALDDMTNILTSSSQEGSLEIVDMYAGVGTIGITVGSRIEASKVTLVEVDPNSAVYLARNILHTNSDTKFQPFNLSADKALAKILSSSTLIIDPPRAGVSKAFIEAVLTARPKEILYLSCNPSTQARDVASWLDAYSFESLTPYNFFPHTPHIESLAHLRLK